MSLRHMRAVVEASGDIENQNKIITPGISSGKKSVKQREKDRKRREKLIEEELLREIELQDKELENLSLSDCDQLEVSDDCKSDDDEGDGGDDKCDSCDQQLLIHRNTSKNSFQMLAGSDDECDDDDEERSNVSLSTTSSLSADETPSIPSTPTSTCKPMPRKNNKNKKNKNKKETAKNTLNSSLMNKKNSNNDAKRNPEPCDPEPDIDELVKQVYGENYVPRVDVKVAVDHMKVVKRHLLAHSESQKKFGCDAVRNVTDVKLNKDRTQYMKTGMFIKPLDSWITFKNSGFRMVPDENPKCKESGRYFKFVHSPEYIKCQIQFENLSKFEDSEGIIKMASDYPCHIDTLQQVAYFFSSGDQKKECSDMIARAVYLMERSLHSTFDATDNTCRMDYKRRENRTFFLILYRHMMIVSKLCCYRTSTEICKFIYSLDHKDPLGVLLIMDFMALKDNNFKFIINVFEDVNSNPLLKSLPNWIFSVALSYFKLSKFTRLPEKDRIEYGLKADKCMTNAFILHPGMLKVLTAQCGIVVNEAITSSALFLRRVKPSLSVLYQLYACRSHQLWKVERSKVPDWLVKNANNACQTYSKVKHCKDQCNIDLKFNGDTPRNVFRHIHLAGFSEVTALLPVKYKMESILYVDPIIPANSYSDYPKKLATPEIGQGELTRMQYIQQAAYSLIASTNPMHNFNAQEEPQVGINPEDFDGEFD